MRRFAIALGLLASSLGAFVSPADGAEASDTLAPPRAADDAERDRTSRPFEVLDFLGVAPGMRVLDVFAGNGYYSEAAALVVGPTGRVYLHNSQGSVQSLARLQQRLAGGRLPNVEPVHQELDALLIPAQSMDVVLLVKVYHDFYYANHGWSVSPDTAFRTIHGLLKPGGVLGVIDHEAPAGSGIAFVHRLHRIDAAFARADIESRGFVFEADAPLLQSTEDPLSVPVFDASVRGRTSRFVQRYRKPGLTSPG